MEIWSLFLAFVGANMPIYGLLFWIGLRLGRLEGAFSQHLRKHE